MAQVPRELCEMTVFLFVQKSSTDIDAGLFCFLTRPNKTLELGLIKNIKKKICWLSKRFHFELFCKIDLLSFFSNK